MTLTVEAVLLETCAQVEWFKTGVTVYGCLLLNLIVWWAVWLIEAETDASQPPASQFVVGVEDQIAA